jgi:hypothetical protein
LDSYKKVVVKNEGVALRDGEWKFYDPMTGTVARTQVYTLGKLEKTQTSQRSASDSTQAVTKPKEVLDFEKKAGKKKVKCRMGVLISSVKGTEYWKVRMFKVRNL